MINKEGFFNFYQIGNQEFRYQHLSSNHEHKSGQEMIFVSHTHRWYEFFQLLQGQINYIVNGQRYMLFPGDIIIINRNEFHSLDIQSSVFERRVAEFDFDFATEIGKQPFTENSFFGKDENCKFITKDSAIAERLTNILDKIDISIKEKIHTDEFMRIFASELLLELDKARLTQSYMPDYNYTVHPAITAIKDYIDQNICAKFSLNDISHSVHLSKSYMCHLFKNHVGTTLFDYISLKKMLYAENLIKKGASPAEACNMLGYLNYSNFYILYKRYLNTTPSATKRSASSF